MIVRDETGEAKIYSPFYKGDCVIVLGGGKKHPKGGGFPSEAKSAKIENRPLLFRFLAVFGRRGEFRFFPKTDFFTSPPRIFESITQSPIEFPAVHAVIYN